VHVLLLLLLLLLLLPEAEGKCDGKRSGDTPTVATKKVSIHTNIIL